MLKRFPDLPWVTQLLLLISVVAACILAVPVKAENSCEAVSFGFVKPGETTEAEMITKCGAPWLQYETNVFENEIDPEDAKHSRTSQKFGIPRILLC